ncbi:protein of unknown function [Paenibacillus sp. cl6col]|uniref:DUF4179 domain-containing protein n=1 Tax=Paenibacillus sp. cl6col TaxID=1761878 RepID=UPI0008838448|nr:DUF4179 domain-containing protein [Paenibacillus sp. cl6col]SDG53194.1 protein of unknown function [Paenibacillus sp. cl6col]
MGQNCINQERIEELMIQKQLGTVMKHIEGCIACRLRLEACIEEGQMLKDALFHAQPDEDFTAQVMAGILSTDSASIEEQQISEDGENYRGWFRRKLRIRWPLVTAAGLLLVLLSMSFAQPTIANWIKSLFSTTDTVDVSLLHSENLGIHHFANIKVSDKGYTLEIKEVVVDTARALIAYRLTDPSGKVVNDMFDRDLIAFTDANGKSLGARVTGNDFLPELKDTGYVNSGYRIAKISFVNTPETDTIHMNGKIDHIGHASDKPRFNDLLHGDWSFSMEIDITLARKKMQVIPLHDAKYTSPDGTQIEATKLIYHASAYQIEFQTKISLAAVRPSDPIHLNDYHQLGFYLEDQHGNMIGRVNYAANDKDEDYRSSLDNVYCRNDNKDSSDLITCIYTMYNIRDNVPDPARIVVKNYNLPVHSSESVTVNMKQLSSHPVIWKAHGDELTVMKVDGFEDSRPYVKLGKGTSLKLIVSGVFRNNFEDDQWVATDETGQVYSLYISHSGSSNYKNVEDDRMTHTLDNYSFALVDGMQHIPKQLTLTRKVTDKLFTGLEWSILLPARTQED